MLNVINNFINERIMNEQAIADRNPTQDQQGRYHAPCNNFEWFDGIVYMAGEYLPTEDYSHNNGKIRFKCTVEWFNDNLATLKRVGDASMGKSWEHQGSQIGYCYLTAPMGLINRIKPLIKGDYKHMVECAATEQGAFKFTLRGVTYAFNTTCNRNFDTLEYWMADRGLEFGDHIELNEVCGVYKNPKNKKAMFYSKYAGKYCRINYITHVMGL